MFLTVKPKLILLFLLSGFVTSTLAQRPYKYATSPARKPYYTSAREKQKYFGADLNPILSSVLPFNGINRNSPMALVQRTYWGEDGIRTGLGINTDASVPYFTFEVGYDRRRELDKSHWCFFKGTELGLNVFERKSSSIFSSSGWVNGVYFSAHYGAEYMIDSRFSISTEARLGIYSSVGVRISPPVNFIFHLKL